jgi:hypothetical protein
MDQFKMTIAVRESANVGAPFRDATGRRRQCTAEEFDIFAELGRIRSNLGRFLAACAFAIRSRRRSRGQPPPLAAPAPVPASAAGMAGHSTPGALS